MLDLPSSVGEACLHRGFVLTGPTAQALFEDLHTGREDEHPDGVGSDGLDLARALVVDIEQQAPRVRRSVNLGLASAVEIAVHRGPLEKRASFDQLREFGALNEVVLAA